MLGYWNPNPASTGSESVPIVISTFSRPRAVTSTRILGTVLNDATFSLADRERYVVDRQYYAYYDRERRR